MSSFDDFARAAEQAKANGADLNISRTHRRPRRWSPHRYWMLTMMWLRINGWACVWKGAEADLLTMFTSSDHAMMGFTSHELKVYTHTSTGVTQLWLKTGSSLWSFVALWYIMWLVGSHL